MNRILIIAIFGLFKISVYGQDLPLRDSLPLLPLEEAINTALQENYDISIAEKNIEKADKQTFIGNAGLLPSLTANGGYDWNLKTTHIEFVSPEYPTINRDNAKSTSYNGSILLNYTLFDGLSRFYRLNSLQRTVEIREEENRMTIENTIFGVIQQYFQIAQLTHQLEITEKAIEISYERLRRARSKYQLGAMSKLQVLNAEVDLNSDSLNYEQTSLQLSNAKRNLKTLMGQMPEDNFTVETQFAIDPGLQVNNILDKALDNNSNLIITRLNAENITDQERIARAGIYPQLSGNFGYEYQEQNSEASFITSQKNYGWTGGIQLSVPLFNGNTQRIQIQTAQVDLAISEERKKQARLQVRRDVLNAYNEYKNLLKRLSIADEDIKTAEMNLEQSEEAWQLGQISGTDLRRAQLNLIQTANRINDLIIQTKLAEMQLLKLAGILEEEKG